MNLQELTYIELSKLYSKIGLELLSRSWIVLVIMLIAFIGGLCLIKRRIK